MNELQYVKLEYGKYVKLEYIKLGVCGGNAPAHSDSLQLPCTRPRFLQEAIAAMVDKIFMLQRE